MTASPRVLMLEYNALFGPEQRLTIPLDQPLADTPKGYGGASLAALEGLARRKGFRLVACEEAGVNAFFLRDDVAPDVQAVPASVAWRALRSRLEMDDDLANEDVVATARERSLPIVEV